MTTPKLPTRQDGGIDWNEILLDSQGYYLFTNAGMNWGIKELARFAAAHERERCAQLAKELGHKNYNGHAIAAAIRAMKD